MFRGHTQRLQIAQKLLMFHAQRSTTGTEKGKGAMLAFLVEMPEQCRQVKLTCIEILYNTAGSDKQRTYTFPGESN